jgi:hypothetical protein
MSQASDAGTLDELAPQPVDWTGTERYAVVRGIARGGMGSVYEAYDRQRRQRVALKTLLYASPDALFMFKQEFRALVDLRHPNLVKFHELVAMEGERVFFSMELVGGMNFMSYVRQQGIERLRSALHQLVSGVQALHAAHKLHRDLKPSNVLVTDEGRVVILDFGVATDLRQAMDGSLRELGGLVGTANYMAPEQGLHEQMTPASDWYSVGVMLYEALVGAPPIDGTVMEVLRLKTKVDPHPPSDRAAGIPHDLDALCVALLDREPTKRPTGPEILRRLAVTPDSTPAHVSATTSATPAKLVVREMPLVGRAAQLLALRDAFEASRAGRSITVHVSGRAGMGKSTLAEHFLDELVQRGDAIVLRGRAYERESVPYKAVDAVIDALSRHLMHLSDTEPTLPLPKHMDALARLFPVLRRVPSVAQFRREFLADPQRTRQRGFQALRELVAGLAVRRPLVLFVDDVQWGDKDSVALLVELVRPPSPPPILLILAHREEDAKTAAFLAELETRWPGDSESRRISVGPLEEGEARRCALALLGDGDESEHDKAAAVARESGGSPFLIEELARSSTGDLSTNADGAVTLEAIVGARLAQLPDDARKVAEMVAVGGRPLAVSTLGEAASIDSIDDAIARLVASRFVRAGLRDGREVVESIHDRIRETIVGQLAASVAREHHAQLAQALEAMPDADPEALAMHWLGAGDSERAARFAEAAGEQVATKLAFDQAAHLFRVALEHAPGSPTSPVAHRLRARLAEVLQFAGRYEESARAYLAAAEGAPTEQVIELRRAAAEQLLNAGRMDEGAQMLHGVLGAIGMRAPRSPLASVFWLLVYRVWLALVGLRFKEREAESVRHEDRTRIDALFTVANGFSIVDVILGACMETRHLIEALRKGDRFQVLRATNLEAAHLSATGKRESRLELALIEIAKRIADRDHRPQALVYYAGCRGIGLWNRGRWKEARTMLERAVSVPMHGFAGFSTIRLFDVYVYYFLGAFRECTTRLERLLAEAIDRRDLYTLVNLRTAAGTWLSLVADEPERARSEMGDALSQWSHKGFSLQHWQEMVWGAEIDLYAGDGERARRHLEQRQRRLNTSFLLHAGFIRASTLYMRGRAAIASIRSRPEMRQARIAEARRMARRLAREYDAWTGVLATLLKAMAENAAGDRATTIAALRDGIDRAQATDTILYALPARYRLGELLGGDEGRALTQRAVEAMTAEGVKDPERWVGCHLPGDWK